MEKKLVILGLVLLLMSTLACTAPSSTVSQTTSSATTSSTPSVTETVATPTPTASPAPEVEASEFMGKALTPLNKQRNNALAGTQTIDRASYRLTVGGLVDTPLSLTYEDLLALPQVSKLMDLDCVEGWKFTAKWTGPTLKSIFEKAGVKAEAQNVIFHTADVPEGYSSLLLSYILDKDIIIGLKINDLTLPAERGFPFQVVAESKYGYKWAKWVTEIELSDNLDFKGYWESYGYNNNADVGGPGFGGVSIFGP
jgi:DMSO/TMAO reductase YedYZ molybdopterin-dependent catalytic subunit